MCWTVIPTRLTFLSAIRCAPIASLGVSDFGQSGDVDDLYRHFGIDTDAIVAAAIDLLKADPGEDGGTRTSGSGRQRPPLSRGADPAAEGG